MANCILCQHSRLDWLCMGASNWPSSVRQGWTNPLRFCITSLQGKAMVKHMWIKALMPPERTAYTHDLLLGHTPPTSHALGLLHARSDPLTQLVLFCEHTLLTCDCIRHVKLNSSKLNPPLPNLFSPPLQCCRAWKLPQLPHRKKVLSNQLCLFHDCIFHF